MDMDDLEAMGITFDETSNVISIAQDGQEMVRIQLPDGIGLEDVAESLMAQMPLAGMSGQESCAQVREDIEMVDDALIDMIENNDAESDQVAVAALSGVVKNVVMLLSAVCENEQEKQHVDEQIVKPLTAISKSLLLTSTGARELGRDELVNIAASWLPIRAAVEAILDEIED